MSILLCRWCKKPFTRQPYNSATTIVGGCELLKLTIKFRIRAIADKRPKEAQALARANCPRGGTGRR